MRLLRPVPRPLARLLSVLALVAWVAQMGVLARRSWSSSPVALAADLAHYGASAQWRGIYYRGDKIGFSVGQTTPTETGYEIREDGRLQMALLGSTASVRLASRATVDPSFHLRAFSFSLDPGTGFLRPTFQGWKYLPGVYRVLPASAFEMYDPQNRGESEPFVIEVIEARDLQQLRSLTRQARAERDAAGSTPEQLASNEDFWFFIQQALSITWI